MSATVFWENGAEFATLGNTFTVNGVPTDPTTAQLVVTDPQGGITTYSWPAGSPPLTRLNPGVFQALQPVGASDGLWTYVWIGTGTASDVVAGTWRVFPTNLGQFYTSAEELKSRLGIDDAEDDYEIALAVTAAARYINSRCGRFFWQITETRTFVPHGIWTAHIDDLVAVTAMTTDPNGDGTFPQTWTEGVDFQLAYGPDEYNAMATGEPRPFREVHVIGGGSQFFPYYWPLTRADRIKIAGTWGWPAVPPAVTHASLILAADLFKLKDAPFGVQGFADFGVMRVQAGSQVEYLLNSYIDPRRKVGV